tara:strand:+ start:2 stop:2152 length:2151 start_codon:yes stop_codon:yes gene_type:complete
MFNFQITNNIFEPTSDFIERSGKYFISSDPSAINLYLEYGDKFTEHLDNEFLLVVSHSFYLDFFTDPWGTRQVNYFEQDDKFYFTSLIKDDNLKWIPHKLKILTNEREPNNHYSLPINSHCRFDTRDKSFKVLNNKLHSWEFGKGIDSMELVEETFNNAVIQKWEQNCTLLLSSGVDSTAAAACLADNKKKFNALTVLFKPEFEDEDVLSSFVNYCGEYINHQEIRETTINHAQRVSSMSPDGSIKHPVLAESFYRAKNVFKSHLVLTGMYSTLAGAPSVGYRPLGPLYRGMTWDDKDIAIYRYHEAYAIDAELEIRHIYLNKKLIQAWHDLDDKFKLMKKPLMRKYVTDRNLPFTENTKSGMNHQSHYKGPVEPVLHTEQFAVQDISRSMSKVLYYSPGFFEELTEKPEYKLAKFGGIITPCFRFGFVNSFDLNFDPLPEIPKDYNTTFEEVTNRRAIELWNINKPIRLWWSGGIDSTCALVALLNTKRSGDDLIVYLSNRSIQENPNFYDKLISMKIPFQWHDEDNYIFDNVENWNGKTINVNGGGGDELFISITEHKKRGHGIETLNLKELFEIKDTHWSNVTTNEELLQIIYDYITISPYNIETCWELMWWLNRTIDDLCSRYMSPKFLKDPSVYSLEHSFFYSKDFDLWAFANPYAGHESYKGPLKKFIYNFDKNKAYFEHKQKISSLPYTWAGRPDFLRNRIIYEDGTYV